MLTDYLCAFGWEQGQIDPAIWIMDKGSHYEYLIGWVGDLLILSIEPMLTIEYLKKRFSLKGVGCPEYFLGADVRFGESNKDTFTIGSKRYVQ